MPNQFWPTHQQRRKPPKTVKGVSFVQQEAVLDKERHMAALQWGFRLFLGVQLIPFIVMFTMRYELASWYVAPTVNQWMGAAEAVIMLLSLWCAYDGLQAIRNDDLYKMQHRTKTAVGFGLLYMALVIYEWSQRFVPAGTRFGEIFYTTIGVSAFYTLAGLFVMTAIAIRSGRAHFSRHNYWDVQAVTWYWVFQGAVAVIAYMYLYWI